MNPSTHPKTHRIPSFHALGLSLIVLGFAPTLGLAQFQFPQFGLFTYTTTENGIAIIRYPQSAVGPVEIPASIEGLPVTTLGPQAFSGCTNLTRVTIPDSVTTIGEVRAFSGAFRGTLFFGLPWGTFNGCTRLTHVTIPASVTTIGDGGFSNCTSLTDVTIPDGVAVLGRGAFAGCTGLTNVTLPAGITTLPPQAFQGCSNLSGVTIPNGVSHIEGGAFEGCTALTHMLIPPGVTRIGSRSFADCTALSGLAISSGVAEIGSGAFAGCTALPRVLIPDSVTDLGPDAFHACTSLQAIDVDSRNTVYASLDGVVFSRNRTVLFQYPAGRGGGYALPDEVVEIGSAAFSSCTGLTHVTFPPSLRLIGGSVFSVCTGLTNVAFNNGIASIHNEAFLGCTGLTHVTFPSGLNYIGHGAFSGCSGLKDVTFHDGVTMIEGEAFSDCTGLTRVSIPASLSRIGTYAFLGCTGLKAIEVDPRNPGYVSVDGVLFSKDGLNLHQYPGGKSGSYRVPNGVTTLHNGAFAFCPGLTRVVFPNSLSRISVLEINWAGGSFITSRYGLFEGCPALEGVYFQGGCPEVRGTEPIYDAGFLVYRLPGSPNWEPTFLSLPTAHWSQPLILGDAPGSGVGSDGFGFTIAWVPNVSVVVEASHRLDATTWTAVGTNVLAGGTSRFADPLWAAHPDRFYRVRTP